MLTNKYFTKDEIIETLENANEYSADDFESLFDDMFNSDYYIIGTYKASKALETFKNDGALDDYATALNSVFGAIDLVKQYELDQFGEVNTPLGDPESVANTVEYIRGEHAFNKALDKAGLDIDSKATAQNIKKFIQAAKTL